MGVLQEKVVEVEAWAVCSAWVSRRRESFKTRIEVVGFKITNVAGYEKAKGEILEFVNSYNKAKRCPIDASSLDVRYYDMN